MAREIFVLAINENGAVSIYPSPEMTAEDIPAMVEAHAAAVRAVESGEG